jgi:hypothetical protein
MQGFFGSDADTIDAALAAASEQNQFNRGISTGQLANQTRQVGVASAAQKATAAYQQGLLKQAMKELQEKAHEFEQTFGLQEGTVLGIYKGQPTLTAKGQEGQMLGVYNGQPTLANLAQQAQFLGTYNGQPTQQAQNQQQQYGLQVGALTGAFEGNPTLAAQNQQQQYGLQQGALTGLYQNQPTLAALAQLAQQRQAQAQLGLNTLQLGSQLSGPSNWLQYENTAGAARANPLLQQGVASWADLTNTAPTGVGAASSAPLMAKSLGTLAGDFGLNGAPTGAGPSSQPTADALAQIGQNTNQWAPGWWANLNPDQQKMAADAWSMSGQSPDTVLSNAARNAISQGFGFRAA